MLRNAVNMFSGLSKSRWAPSSDPHRIEHRSDRYHPHQRRPSTPTSSQPSISYSDSLPPGHIQEPRNGPSPQEENERFLRIVTRLNWKLPFLKQGYNQARDAEGKLEEQIQTCETQFKLDFHEFHMLLERAIVHLMGIYGIVIDGNPRTNGLSDSTFNTYRRPSQHTYHANVLAALNDPKNPLNPIFRESEVQGQLFRAKQLRNRWKHADNIDETPDPHPLSSYNIDLMMRTILDAIERAHDVAMYYMRKDEVKTTASSKGNAREDWDFMVDAMDWEAV
ncbi:hypothetical protein F4677DRAFT_435813 [Hypoxylon crocopeplum]|nr:hypothetical protein F4677DRAFT_435813 [Hypoxylon crocopeplum]